MERADLADRQELGLRSYDLLDRNYAPTRRPGVPAEETALDRFGVQRGRPPTQDKPKKIVTREKEDVPRVPLREPISALGGGLLGLLGQLGESLSGGTAKPDPKPAPEPDALERFQVQRGQPPPGDAGERAAQERERAHAERQQWREWHQYEPER